MIYCFYHSADLDGHCSGAIVKYHVPEAELRGINYGETFPWDDIKPDDTVYMVDFSLQPKSDMHRLNGACNLIWIDHHKSAIEEVGTLDCEGFQEVGLAGCELSWRYFKGDIEGELPEFIALLGRYDVWDNKDKELWENEILPFQKGFRYEFPETDPSLNFELWLSWIKGTYIVYPIIASGLKNLEFSRISNKTYIEEFGFATEFEGLRAIAVNKGMANSMLFDSVWDAAKYDIMIIFINVKGIYWTVELYAPQPGVDVSVLAQKHGGGGHPGASGFQCQELPFKVIDK